MNIRKQESVCEWQKVAPIKPLANSAVGLAIDYLEGKVIHGLRHKPELNSNGWYIWTGDFVEKDYFFKPVCIEHLSKYIKIDLTEYLDLPPGFRFLVDNDNYEDVWFDKDLII